MKKTMLTRMGALPLRHKIAASALSLSILAGGAGSVQMAALFSALQRGIGPALRTQILPNEPGDGKQVGQRNSGARESGSQAQGRQGGTPSLERIVFSSAKTGSTSLSEERSREETLLGLTLAQLDERTAALERELQQSLRKRHSVEEAQASSEQLSTLRKQRVLISKRLGEEREYASSVRRTVSEATQSAVAIPSKPALPLQPAASPIGPVSGGRGVLGMMFGLVAGIVYLGLALWRYRPMSSGDLAALGVRTAVPVLGSVARIRP